MKIGQPVTEASARGTNTSYAPLHAAIQQANGLFVPVVCDDKKEATRIYNALRQNGRYDLRRRDLTIFAKVKVILPVNGAGGNHGATEVSASTAASAAQK